MKNYLEISLSLDKVKWKNVPATIKAANSVGAFKRGYRNHSRELMLDA